jgi:hypothetical protein
MANYRQTIEEAARVLSLIHGEYAAAIAYALRSGLAPALDRARQEERERWHRMIEGQLAAERQGIETGEARNRELHHYSILVLEYIRDTWPLPAPPPPTPAADELPRTEPDGRRTGDCDCPACDAADAGGRRCGTCAMACSMFKPAHWSCSSWTPRQEEGSRGH